MENEKISPGLVSSRSLTGSEIARPVTSHSRTGSNMTVAGSQMSQRSKLQRSRRREPKNVLTRIEKITAGPLMVLKKALVEKHRVKVLIRTAVQMRGICTGFVVVFDRHMNMVLSDVDEVYRNPLLLYKGDAKGTIVKKKKKKQTLPSGSTAQLLVDSQKSMLAESTEITASVGDIMESSQLGLHSTERGSQIQYDTSSDEELEEQIPAAVAEDLQDVSICKTDMEDGEVKSSGGNVKKNLAGTSETSTSEDVFCNRQSKHVAMMECVEKTRHRTGKTTSVHRIPPHQFTITSSDNAHGKEDGSRKYHYRSRDSGVVHDYSKDRNDSTENLREARMIPPSTMSSLHGSLKHQSLSQSYKRSCCEGNITHDKGSGYAAVVKQTYKLKDACYVTKNPEHHSCDTSKSQIPERQTQISERNRYKTASEKESVATVADQVELKNKSGTNIASECSLRERKDNGSRSTKQKCRLAKSKDDVERTVMELHSQIKQSDHIAGGTLVNQRTKSSAGDKTKQTAEVLKRHVNKLFIRGDNVVMVVREE